jgi:hypothetical protein
VICRARLRVCHVAKCWKLCGTRARACEAAAVAGCCQEPATKLLGGNELI